MIQYFIRAIIISISAGFILTAQTVTMPENAQAQVCSFSSTDLDFGTIDISDGLRVRTTGSFTANCSGTPNTQVRICVNYGSGTGGNGPAGDPRHMLSGTNSLNFNIFKNSAYSRIWGSDVWPYPPNGRGFRVNLNNSGTGSRTIPTRAEIYASQAGTPNGLYNSSFSGGHTLIAYTYFSGQNCRNISGFITTQVPFNVRANILSACTVSATDLNFGSVGVLNSNVDATNTISVQCSNGTPYSLSLDGGLTGATNPALRKMTNGGSDVTYGIYQNSARTIPWGDIVGTNTISAIGNGTTQNYTAYGRVPPQTTPVPGTYTDTVVVTMTY